MNAVHQRVGGKSAEDHRVRGADAGAGQHGDGQLGRHPHVDGNPVALSDAERFQDVGELLHFAMQLLVGEGADFAGLALPDQRGLVLAEGLHVAVETVVGKIELAADKPLGPGMIPFQNLVPLLEPVQIVGDAAPEFFRLLDRLAIDALVVFQALDVRLLAEGLRTFEFSVLVQDGLDIAAVIGRGGLSGMLVPRMY